MPDTILGIITFEKKLVSDQAKFDASLTTHATVTYRSSMTDPLNVKKHGSEQKKHKKNGEYFPIIWLESRRQKGRKDRVNEIIFQCSVPKLLFGSSYYEATAAHLPDFCRKMSDAFSKVGLSITPLQVQNAVLRSADFCKNIYLTNGVTANEIIDTSRHFDIKKKAEVRMTTFGWEKEVRLANYYTPSKNLKFYNKMEEIRVHGFTPQEKALGAQQDLEVLRAEISLQKRQSTQRAFSAAYKRLGRSKKKCYTVQDCFDVSLAKDILLTETQQVIDLTKAQTLFYKAPNTHKQLQALISIMPTDAAFQVAVYMQRAQTVGLAQAQKEFKSYFPRSTAKTRIKQLNLAISLLPPQKCKRFNLVKVILKELTDFNLVTGVVL